MAEISLVVPVYNVEACLPQCMDSIRRQTLSNIEIICVVDGSTDRSETLLRLYSRLDSRVRIVVKENGGLSSARNAGIKASTAPIVMFVDADDLLADRACQTVRDAFGAHDADMVTFGAECYPSVAGDAWYEMVLSPGNAYYPEFHTDILFKEQSRPFVWRTACKRDFLERTGLRFDETVRFGEDQIFHFAAYPKAHGVTFIPDKLYRYRLVREGSLMSTRLSDERLKLQEHLVITDRVCAEWKRDGLMGPYGVQLAEWVADFLLYDIMVCNPAYRLELAEGLGALLGNRFSRDALEAAGYADSVRNLLVLLAKGGASAEDFEAARGAYLDSIGYREGAGRPGWKSKLRHIVPMSALGLEERLDSAAARSELSQWIMADSAASTRSLEMLHLELLAHGMRTTLD